MTLHPHLVNGRCVGGIYIYCFFFFFIYIYIYIYGKRKSLFTVNSSPSSFTLSYLSLAHITHSLTFLFYIYIYIYKMTLCELPPIIRGMSSFAISNQLDMPICSDSRPLQIVLCQFLSSFAFPPISFLLSLLFYSFLSFYFCFIHFMLIPICLCSYCFSFYFSFLSICLSFYLLFFFFSFVFFWGGASLLLFFILVI